MVRRSLPCPWLPWTWAWGTGPWAPGSGGTAPAPCAVRDRKSTMDWVSNICCRSTCIISGSWLTGTPTGTPPGPPPGPLLVSRKPGGIANVTPLAGVLCDVDGPADWPVDWPVCQVPEDKKLPSDLPPHLYWSSAMVLCLPMGHHFLVEDLPCGTQVLFLHWQPHHFLRPFLQEHWTHFLDSQCCLAPYLDSLAQVQTSSQVKIS